MKCKIHKASKLFILFLPFSLFLNSCGSDFPGVQQLLNDNLTGLNTSSESLAQDIYDSCLRRANYVSLTATNGINNREDLIKGCDEFNRPNVGRIKKANEVLLDYMTSLGKVASGKTVTFDQSINALTKSLTDLNIGNTKVSTPVIQAGTGILSVLLNVFSRSERRSALKKAILCSDDALHIYITGNHASEEDKPASGGLIQIAQDGYINGILKIEKTQINVYFQNYFDEFSKSNQIRDQLEVEKDYNTAMDVVKTKSNNAQSYIDTLQATAKAHHKLKMDFQGTGKNAISAQEITTLCRDISAGKGSDLKKSDNYSKLNLTKEQLQKAKVIIAEYAQTIKSLRKDSK